MTKLIFMYIITVYIFVNFKKGVKNMEKFNESGAIVRKLQYSSPSVCKITVDRDIVTESHNDPNMGEWDTQLD